MRYRDPRQVLQMLNESTFKRDTCVDVSSPLCLCLSTCICIHSFIDSGYFYSASSSPLLLRGVIDYSIDTVSELTYRRATGSCE